MPPRLLRDEDDFFIFFYFLHSFFANSLQTRSLALARLSACCVHLCLKHLKLIYRSGREYKVEGVKITRVQNNNNTLHQLRADGEKSRLKRSNDKKVAERIRVGAQGESECEHGTMRRRQAPSFTSARAMSMSWLMPAHFLILTN